MEKILRVEGMHCPNCVRRVEKSLAELGAKAEADLKTGQVRVTSDKELPEAELREAIESLGFEFLGVK